MCWTTNSGGSACGGEMTWYMDVIGLLDQGKDSESICRELSTSYSDSDVKEAISECHELEKQVSFSQKTSTEMPLLISKHARPLSRRSVCTLPMTVIWPVSTALPRRESTMAAERS